MTYLDYHTHTYDDSPDVQSVINQYPLTADTSRFFSVGIHPWYINLETMDEELQIIQELAIHPNCYAIGECGLDRLSDISLEIQTEVFKKQIAISEEFQKPLAIHCVKAYSEIVALKKELNPTQKWVLHGFRKNWKVAESLLNNGIVLSFGAPLLYDKKLQEVFMKTPKNQFYLETDDAEISIKEIYRKAEELRSEDIIFSF